MASVSFFVPPASAVGAVWYVNDGSISGDSFTYSTGSDTAGLGTASAPFKSIQKAVDSAAAGDTIYIDAGLYDSFVIVNGSETAGVHITKDTITLIGQDSNATVIDPPGPKTQSNLYGIYADTQTGLVIKNLGVTGAFYGIKFINVDNATLAADSTCSVGDYGIYLFNGSDANTLAQNDAGFNGSGIVLDGSAGNTVKNNRAVSNSFKGIWLYSSSSNTISGNTTNSNSQYGIALETTSNNNTVSNHTANSNTSHGITMNTGSNNNIVKISVFRNNLQAGVDIASSNTNLFTLNDIIGNDTGVRLTGTSSANDIAKNNLLNNTTNNVAEQSGITQTFPRNWWGTTNEVAIKAKFFDSNSINSFQPYRFGQIDTAPGADTTAPAKPIAVTLDTNVPGQIRIRWIKPTVNEETNGGQVNLKDVIIYRLKNTPDTNHWANPANEIGTVLAGGPNDTEFLDTNVQGGNTYYYRLTAVDSSLPFENESFFTDTKFAVADTPPPLPPGPKKWFVNDNSTVGDSFTFAVGADTNLGDADTSPFRTIMKALQLAKANDTILVDAGLYAETVVIDTDGIHLVGKDSNATVIDPPGAKTVTGLYGISSTNRKAVHIKNIGVTGAYQGIRLSNVDDAMINSDSITYVGDVGIFLTAGSDNNKVLDNYLYENASYSIQLDSGFYNSVSNNTSESNSYGILLFSGLNFINSNTFDSNLNIGIYLSSGADNDTISNNTVRGNGTYGIYVGPGTKNLITGNMVRGNPTGIYLTAGNNNVRNNIVRNNTGVGLLIDADTNTVSQNEIFANDTGVKITGALAAISLMKNNIHSNTTQNYFSGAGNPLQISRNWWGTTDEVTISAKFSDTNSAFRPYRLGVVDTGVNTDTTAPGKPLNVTLDTAVAGQIKVSWTIPNLDEETNGGGVAFNGLHIWRLVNQVDTNNWANLASRVRQTSPTDTFWVDTGVTGGNTYYYRLTSHDASPNLNESFFTDTKFATAVSNNPQAVLQLIEENNQIAPDVVPGETGTMRVIDTGVNTNSALVETLTIRIKNLATNEQETVILSEIDSNNAVFEVKVRASANPADNASGNNKLYVVAGDTVQFDYTDPGDPADTKQLTLKVIAFLEVIIRAAPDTQVKQGETGAVLAFSVINTNPPDNSSGTDTLIQIQVTRLLGMDSHVVGAGVKIWRDTGPVGVFQPNVDILLDSATLIAGAATFNNLSGPYMVVGPGDTRDFIVSFQISDTALSTDSLDAKLAAGGISHVLGGSLPDTNENSPGALSIQPGKPKILMSTGQDPILLPGSYSGPVADTIPGATLTYVIRYDNDGGETSVNFVLNAKIPQNTKLAQADTSLVSAHTNAVVTVTITDDSGVVVPDTDPSALRIKWTFTTGVAPDNGDPHGVVDAMSADFDAGIVKYKVYIK